MFNRYNFFSFFLVIFFSIFIPQSLPQDTPNKDVIFLIDQSASMNKNNLFTEVKGAIQESIQKTVKTGDNVFVYGFDEKVYVIDERNIKNGVNDIFELNGKIDKLKATGKWTYITAALEVAAKRLERLNSNFPQNYKVVYLFTDGINDPPPTIENPVTYSDLIKKYFSTFKAKNTFTYVFKFGVQKPDPGLDTLIQGDTSKSFIVLQPGSITKEFLLDSRIIVDTLNLEVNFLFNVPKNFEITFESNDLQINPNSVVKIKEPGQQIRIVYGVESNNLSSDKNLISIIPKSTKEKVKIFPEKLFVEYIKKQQTKIDSILLKKQQTKIDSVQIIIPDEQSTDLSWLWNILIIIIVIAVLGIVGFVVCKKIIPKFTSETTITFHTETSTDGPIFLSDFNKFCLSSVTVGRDGDIIFEDDIFLKITPTRSGIKLKITEGSLFQVIGNEKEELSSGKSYEIQMDTKFTTLNDYTIEIKLI